jgi:hypothetical protein
MSIITKKNSNNGVQNRSNIMINFNEYLVFHQIYFKIYPGSGFLSHGRFFIDLKEYCFKYLKIIVITLKNLLLEN